MTETQRRAAGTANAASGSDGGSSGSDGGSSGYDGGSSGYDGGGASYSSSNNHGGRHYVVDVPSTPSPAVAARLRQSSADTRNVGDVPKPRLGLITNPNPTTSPRTGNLSEAGTVAKTGTAKASSFQLLGQSVLGNSVPNAVARQIMGSGAAPKATATAKAAPRLGLPRSA